MLDLELGSMSKCVCDLKTGIFNHSLVQGKVRCEGTKPTRMSKFEREIRAFIDANRELFGADARVWSKAEWAARNDTEANSAPFVVTFEGPLYEIYNYGEYCGMQFSEGNKLREIARKHGYFFESYHGWMIVPCQ